MAIDIKRERFKRIIKKLDLDPEILSEAGLSKEDFIKWMMELYDELEKENLEFDSFDNFLYNMFPKLSEDLHGKYNISYEKVSRLCGPIVELTRRIKTGEYSRELKTKNENNEVKVYKFPEKLK